jgi:argininosuccinate lyase
MDRFVKRQNVAHYRSLLAKGVLDPDQRETIVRLLAEEEKKVESEALTQRTDED